MTEPRKTTARRVRTGGAYPRWIWADSYGMRIEIAEESFVDYLRSDAGMWRQQTKPMTHAESVNNAQHQLGDWQVDAGLAAWLESTYQEVSRD